ncbi:MAG: hypothetical protein ACSLFR_00180 [Solirubrobacteraceae bacterium]
MRDFVRTDEWEEISRTDHYRYIKKLVDGKLLRTRVSFGRGPAFDDPGLWSRVWRHQLDLRSEDEFWEALRTGNPVDRTPPAATAAPTQPTKPMWLVEFLTNVVGLALEDVLSMTEDEAMARHMDHIGPQPA